jgi:hypothetical protein
MGAVYTNNENAIRCTDNIAGIQGRPGFAGPPGPGGNNWAYMPVGPSAKINNAFDENGDLLPTVPGERWPIQGDSWLNYRTGEWYIYQDVDPSPFWELQPTLLQGPKGADDYMTTEVSFNKFNDTTGFAVDRFDEEVVVGHLIFPGTILAGKPISSVQVLVHINSGGDNIRADFRLSSMGLLATDPVDDVLVAQVDPILNGNGGTTSWQIIDLNVLPANVPAFEEVLQLTLRLRTYSAEPVERSINPKALHTYVKVAHLSIR